MHDISVLLRSPFITNVAEVVTTVLSIDTTSSVKGPTVLKGLLLVTALDIPSDEKLHK